MPRVTDANLLFSGNEPKFSAELSPSELMQALSWYSQNKDKKDALKWGCDFFKKKFKLDASSVLKDKISTFGFVCRIVSNGGTLPDKNQIWFNDEIEKIKSELSKTKQPQPVAVKTNVVSIQDRIRDKANDCVGELEGCVDDMIINKFKSNTAPYGIMYSMNIKDAQTRYIIEWAKSRRTEYDNVLNTDDSDVKEAYSNFTKPELKKMIAYFDQVILDCQKISGDSVKSRKPRKRKTKTPEQLVSKLNYMESFDELKLKSIAPTEIIGMMQLWVYNTKTRKLGVYHAEDAGGLSVKGSTLINFSETKSVQKKLRKPEVTIPEVLSGGKVFLRNVIDGIRAVESVLNGRINKDTILLRIVK